MTTKVIQRTFNPIKWLKSFNNEESIKKKIHNFNVEQNIKKQKEKVYVNYGHLMHLK